MKLNYRDLVILGILLALAILIAGFFLLVKPKNEEIKENQSRLEQLQAEADEIDAKVAEIEPLKSNITSTYEETIKLTKDFVECDEILNARQVDQYMQHFAEDCKVKVMTLSTSNLSTGTLNYYYFTPSFLAESQLAQADLNGEKQKENSDAKLESSILSARKQEEVLAARYTISVTAEEVDYIWDYMKAIEEQDKTIIINSVSLGNVEIKEKKDDKKDDKEKPDPTAQFVVSIYSVYDLAKPNLEQD